MTETEQDLISGEMSIGKAKDDLAQIEARYDGNYFRIRYHSSSLGIYA